MSKSVTTVESDSNSIELKKGSKGEYSWTIKVYGDMPEPLLHEVEEINNEMKQRFGGEKQ